MPSLTLYLGGNERSVISLHFDDDFLGITPMRLICALGIACIGNGPSILPLLTSE